MWGGGGCSKLYTPPPSEDHITNVGIMPMESWVDVTAEQMKETYNVNVVGPMMISQVSADNGL